MDGMMLLENMWGIESKPILGGPTGVKLEQKIEVGELIIFYLIRLLEKR
jgi:hypothetical protein